MRNDYEKLLNYAFYILAKKRYTSSELSKKCQQYMQRRDMHDEAILEKVLKRLFELKYLDDDQYAKDYITGRVNFKPKGKYALTKELTFKGIPHELVEKIFEESPLDEGEIAIRALMQKERIWNGLPALKRKEKAFRFLSSRGFRAETIYKIVDKRYNFDTKVES